MWDSTLFRTVNGGETWENVASLDGGPNDFDDMCAPSPDSVWAVQNQNTQGTIWHVRLVDGEDPEVHQFNPFLGLGYVYEGMTCVDDQTALVVGLAIHPIDPSQPKGIIASTTDGGQSWTRHSIPVDDVTFWKVSFVGARR